MKTAIFWCRNDLRLQDNPALHWAANNYEKIIILYIDSFSGEPTASEWWKHEALQDFNFQLNKKLTYRVGKPKKILQTIIKENNVNSVYWNRRYEPEHIKIDSEIKSWLETININARSFPGNLLIEPWNILKENNSPYKVFTPFFKAALKKGFLRTIYGKVPTKNIISLPSELDETYEKRRRPWMKKFEKYWEPTSFGVAEKLDIFLNEKISFYEEERDFPSLNACSQMSPFLHFGQISPRELISLSNPLVNSEIWMRQVVWREFSHYILFHFPDSEKNNFNPNFDNISWQNPEGLLIEWQKGLTGIPMVDAGMRELWETGFMHNRVRMIVASYLTKHMQIDWKHGAQWFLDTLLDADAAQNSMGWQWAAGSGVDAAPYFRIFNPALQGEKFDQIGNYIRKWIPEIDQLPNKWIHRPWEAPEDVLYKAKIIIGKDYPKPIVDLKEGREKALLLWDTIKANNIT